MLGASRKSFIGQAAGETGPGARLGGSLASACWCVERGAHIVRTHDVAATRQAVLLIEAVQARRDQPT